MKIGFSGESFLYDFGDIPEYLTWRKLTPVEVVEFSAGNKIIIQAGIFEFFQHVFSEVQQHYPAIFANVVKPFLVITVVALMIVKNIFTDKNVFIDTHVVQLIYIIAL